MPVGLVDFFALPWIICHCILLGVMTLLYSLLAHYVPKCLKYAATGEVLTKQQGRVVAHSFWNVLGLHPFCDWSLDTTTALQSFTFPYLAHLVGNGSYRLNNVHRLWTFRILCLLTCIKWSLMCVCSLFFMSIVGMSYATVYGQRANPRVWYFWYLIALVLVLAVALEVILLYRKATVRTTARSPKLLYVLIGLFVVLVSSCMALSTHELQTTFWALTIGEVEGCREMCHNILSIRLPTFNNQTQCPSLDYCFLFWRHLFVDQCKSHCNHAHYNHAWIHEIKIVVFHMLSEHLSGIQTTLYRWFS